MNNARSTILAVAGLLLLSLTGCSFDDGGPSGGSPSSARKFQGTYEVPTVTPALASAAIFDVPEVEWSVEEGTAELSYDLPRGLVGKRLRVTFSGPIDASGATGTLVGPPGTAACTVTSTAVVCNEKMPSLLPLTPDYAVIEERAKAEYAGPVSDRLDVAKVFEMDPIGIVKVNLGAPVGEVEKVED